MPRKNPNTARIGGPGASHENRRWPEKSKLRRPHPTERKRSSQSQVSGGGGERDRHHSHDPVRKGGG